LNFDCRKTSLQILLFYDAVYIHGLRTHRPS
jgi:hypothetical protein